MAVFCVLVLVLAVYAVSPHNSEMHEKMESDAAAMNMSLGEHTQHLKQAQELARNPASVMPSVPKFNVSLSKPDMVMPDTPVKIDFTVYDATTGNQVTKFDIISEKLMHLIIVNDALTYFEHVHPIFDGKKFTISHTFPKNESYRLYTDFQPTGADETQVAFKIPVGTPDTAATKFNRNVFNTSLSKDFAEYNVTLNGSFKVADIVSGTAPFIFSIKNAQNDKPVTDLRPYLGSFGHMVMINVDTFSYIHVHPLAQDFSTGMTGPEVKFQPLALGSVSVTPGTYRIFAQFQPTTGLFTSDFIVDIK